MLSRLSEKVLGWIALGVLVAIGVGIWYMGEDARGNLWSWIWRSLTWLVIVAAVPWVARLFIRRVLEQSTNWAGVVLIAGFTLCDAILGVLLMHAWPSGCWWLMALAVLAVAATYNYLVSEYLAEQAGG